MFLPNSDSFVLTRRPIVKPSFSVFLPNTDSFLLIRRSAENVVAQLTDSINSPQADSEQSKIKDQSKRNFLKVAGVVGASAVASQILSPKNAQALILGSSPTTGVVGVKNSANARINPATEETVSTLLKPSDLTFAAGSLQVKVTSTSGEGSSSFSDSGGVAKSGLVDAARHVQVDVLSSTLPSSASTETTLQTIAFGGVQHALKITTVGSVDYIAEAAVNTLQETDAWRVKKVDSTTGIVITWADGDAGFNNVATDLTILNYS